MPKYVESGELVKGDYVLATKWQDGSSKDHWFVGYFAEQIDDRYFVCHADGTPARINGFRRCEKIHPAIGQYLVESHKELSAIKLNLWEYVESSIHKTAVDDYNFEYEKQNQCVSQEVLPKSTCLEIQKIEKYITCGYEDDIYSKDDNHEFWLQQQLASGKPECENYALLDHPLKDSNDYPPNLNPKVIEAFKKKYAEKVPAKKRNALLIVLEANYKGIPFKAAFHYKPFMRSLKDKPVYNKYSTYLKVRVSTQDDFDNPSTIKNAIRKYIKELIQTAYEEGYENTFTIRDDAVYDWIDSYTSPQPKVVA